MGESFYREQTEEIPSKSVREITYGATQNPNYFYINNLSNAKLYCGVSVYPSNKVYEMVVPPNGSKVYGRKNGSSKFYIYNDSGEVAKAIVMSFSQAFDPVVLASISNVEVDLTGTPTMTDVAITGFSSPLPVGGNKIGRVDIDSLPSGNNKIGVVDIIKMPSIPMGTNNIGQVDIASLPPLPSGNNVVGCFDVKTDSILYSLLSNVGGGSSNPIIFKNKLRSNTADTTSPRVYTQTGDNFFSKISLLSNDGSSDINVNIDGEIIVLKGGETLNDIELGNVSKQITISGGSASLFRFVYLESVV